MKLVIIAIAFSLMLPLHAGSSAENGYIGFAAKSSNGPTKQAACRSYGGLPVVDQHYNVVMRMGRRDSERTNVIYHGGHHYVTFSISTETFWGRRDTIVGLCHFSG